MVNVMATTQAVQQRATAYFDRALAGLATISIHELGAVSGHWAEVQERLAVARKARGVIELVRDQIDLLPETRRRLARDHRRRREIWRAVIARPRAA